MNINYTDDPLKYTPNIQTILLQRVRITLIDRNYTRVETATEKWALGEGGFLLNNQIVPVGIVDMQQEAIVQSLSVV